MTELAEGWGFPGNSRKAHYFRAGEPTSICGKWMYTGHREPPGGSSKDDCAACSKKLALAGE